MEGGDEVMQELQKDRQGGMPWMTILDGDGKELVTSNDPDGKNIGCPGLPHEVEHFVNMIKQSSDIDDEKLKAIDAAIKKYAATL
jgi:hypothetical protein